MRRRRRGRRRRRARGRHGAAMVICLSPPLRAARSSVRRGTRQSQEHLRQTAAAHAAYSCGCCSLRAVRFLCGGWRTSGRGPFPPLGPEAATRCTRSLRAGSFYTVLLALACSCLARWGGQDYGNYGGPSKGSHKGKSAGPPPRTQRNVGWASRLPSDVGPTWRCQGKSAGPPPRIQRDVGWASRLPPEAGAHNDGPLTRDSRGATKCKATVRCK